MSCLLVLVIKPANAQTPSSVPAPSIPQFSAQFVGQPDNALVITVKNQPHNSTDGTLYYNVRLKDHNIPENDSYDVWQYPLDNLFRNTETYPEQNPNSGYTNITITASQSGVLLPGTQIDIQVEAMLGSINRGPVFNSAWRFGGQTSNWSNTQTVEIPATSDLTSTFTTLTVIAILLAVIIASLLILKKRKTVNLKQ